MKPISEHPEHRRIMKELTGLSDVRAKVQTKLAEIEQRLLERPIPGGDAARVDAAREFAATGVVKAPAGDSSALHEERIVLRDQVEPLDHAIAQCHAALAALVGELSAEVRRDIKSRHSTVMQEAREGLKQFVAAYAKEVAMQGEMSRAGYSDHLGNDTVASMRLGSPGEPSCLFERLLTELRSVG